MIGIGAPIVFPLHHPAIVAALDSPSMTEAARPPACVTGSDLRHVCWFFPAITRFLSRFRFTATALLPTASGGPTCIQKGRGPRSLTGPVARARATLRALIPSAPRAVSRARQTGHRAQLQVLRTLRTRVRSGTWRRGSVPARMVCSIGCAMLGRFVEATPQNRRVEIRPRFVIDHASVHL